MSTIETEEATVGTPAAPIDNMSSKIAAKQPVSYTYASDFKIWFDQFLNFCETVKGKDHEPGTEYKLFLTFLDARSFQIVQNLRIDSEEKKDLKGCFTKLNKALNAEWDQVPP